MVYHVIFDEAGQKILTASVDGLIKIFDTKLQLETTIKGHKRDISILTMSSNNKFVISVDEGGIARVWDFPSGRYASLTRSVAVLTEQEGQSVSTASFHTETVQNPETGEEEPWKSFLILSSLTYGLLIYEDRHIGRPD